MRPVFGTSFVCAFEVSCIIVVWRALLTRYTIPWRQAQDPTFEGQLRSDSCYIILNTKRGKVNPGLREHHLFFWMGRKAKEDKKDFTTYVKFQKGILLILYYSNEYW